MTARMILTFLLGVALISAINSIRHKWRDRPGRWPDMTTTSRGVWWARIAWREIRLAVFTALLIALGLMFLYGGAKYLIELVGGGL